MFISLDKSQALGIDKDHSFIESSVVGSAQNQGISRVVRPIFFIRNDVSSIQQNWD
jgi:hypothetical protein